MNETRDVDLLILSPLRGELLAALGRLGTPVAPVVLPGPAKAQEYAVGARRVLAGWTGMGIPATRAALAVLAPRARAVLHVGCAGALDPALATGQVVVCERLLDAAGVALEAGAQGPLLGWLGPALPASVRLAGVSVTLERIIEDAAAKAALRARTGADVVEMESRAAVEAARAAGAPIAALRVVIDRAGEVLPDLTAGLDEVGDPRPFAMARLLASRPSAIPRLPRLARSFSAAQASIAALVAKVVDQVARTQKADAGAVGP